MCPYMDSTDLIPCTCKRPCWGNQIKQLKRQRVLKINSAYKLRWQLVFIQEMSKLSSLNRKLQLFTSQGKQARCI